MLQDISVRYDPEEDRLVLRLTLLADQQTITHWLHLTRRTCSALRKDLQALVDLSAEVPQRLDAVTRQELSNSHHQALASQVPRRVEPASAQPPPERPKLVSKAQCGRRRADGRWVLKFETVEQQGLALVLSKPTLHALVDALNKRVTAADWGLSTLPVEQALTASEPRSSLH